MNNPEMRKMMTDMMKNMDPEGMKNMMKMSGECQHNIPY
jgi:hypothetical protein